MRRSVIAVLAVLAPLAGADVASSGRAQVDENPCLTEAAAELRCPDLRMRRPFGLSVDLVTKPGRVLLRAGNSIDSVGAGPAELHGVRIGRRFMRARQRIYRRGGGRIGLRTGARVFFKFVPGQTFYWKFHNAARFELWRIDELGQRTRQVREGPKVSYCLRDLAHTHRRMARSPRRRVYPSCGTNPRSRKRTLGTSVGWSDVYPPSYPEQWIDVTGLRGCFAYVHIADPLNHLYELDEENNQAQTIVRLPYKRGRQRCPGAGRSAPDQPVPY